MTTAERIQMLEDQVTRNWMVDNDACEILEYAGDLGVHREQVTELALSLSLCPVHFIDYAICFDDDPYECHYIRIILPSHDT